MENTHADTLCFPSSKIYGIRPGPARNSQILRERQGIRKYKTGTDLTLENMNTKNPLSKSTGFTGISSDFFATRQKPSRVAKRTGLGYPDIRRQIVRDQHL
ncbi:hypothetical protein QD336_12030 [Rhizobium sp. BR 250]